MAYVMLTGADGFPKVLNNLCLHCENRKLVSGFIFLAHWLSEIFFFSSFSSFRLRRATVVSLARTPLTPPPPHPPSSFLSRPSLPPSSSSFPPPGHLLWKAGTPWPRQHNRCSVDSGGEEGWGEGASGGGGGWLCGLFYLISVSTRASV